jgi:hypothetical protein
VPYRNGKYFFIVQDGIRMDLLKALYQVMLVEMPRKDVLEFWRRHPITLFKGPLPPKVFLRFLWKGDMSVQPTYFWSLLHDLESYLHCCGMDSERFFHLLNHGPQSGPPLDPGWVAQAMPSLEVLLASGTDPREWLLAGLDRLVMGLLPGCRMKRLATGKDRPAGSSLYLFHPFPKGELPLCDFRLFPGVLLRGLPRLFGWSPFAPAEVIADMRSPGLLIGGHAGADWNWKGDILRHRKSTMGRLAGLEELVDGRDEAPGLRDALGGAANRSVILMDKDFPPHSQAPMLRKGCAYGAPFTLARIGYASSRRWDGVAERLSWKRRLPIRESGKSFESTERLHLELLAAADDRGYRE